MVGAGEDEEDEGENDAGGDEAITERWRIEAFRGFLSSGLRAEAGGRRRACVRLRGRKRGRG